VKVKVSEQLLMRTVLLFLTMVLLVQSSNFIIIDIKTACFKPGGFLFLYP
jgi:hypothetical protein